jgi:hypothetical protein
MKFTKRRVEANAWKYLEFLSPFFNQLAADLCFHFVSLMAAKWYACCRSWILSCRSWLDGVLCSYALSRICMQSFVLSSMELRPWNLFLAYVVMSFRTLLYLSIRLSVMFVESGTECHARGIISSASLYCNQYFSKRN